MSSQNHLLYQGFLLNCEPLQLPSGRFAAHLVISLKDQKCIFAGRLSPVRDFGNMEDAVTYSASWGKAWIDDNE
ncbi:hypothetical protein [Pseudoduganella sp. UC29_71]|uniref:hypothetical protein n=1 Tax=Pseudoduganella sp. UC29_71 TaxID=3350174 RepID=UPI003670C8B9